MSVFNAGIRIVLTCAFLHIGLHGALAEQIYHFVDAEVELDGGCNPQIDPQNGLWMRWEVLRENTVLDSFGNDWISFDDIGRKWTLDSPQVIGELHTGLLLAWRTSLLPENPGCLSGAGLYEDDARFRAFSDPVELGAALTGIEVTIRNVDIRFTDVHPVQRTVFIDFDVRVLATGNIWLNDRFRPGLPQTITSDFNDSSNWLGSSNRVLYPATFASFPDPRYANNSTYVTFSGPSASSGLRVHKEMDFFLDGNIYDSGFAIISGDPSNAASVWLENDSSPSPGMLRTSGLILGDEAGEHGGLFVGGGNSLANEYGGPIVVGNRGIGSLVVSDGSSAVVRYGFDTDLIIGAEAGAIGYVSVEGENSQFTIIGDLIVGKSGVGSLEVYEGGIVTTNSFFIASRSGPGASSEGSGHVLVGGAGSKIRSQFGLEMATEDGSFAELEIYDGGVVEPSSPVPADAIVGKRGVARVTVSGEGSKWLLDGNLVIATGPNSSATLTVNDGGILWNKGLATLGGPFAHQSTIDVDGGQWWSGVPVFDPDELIGEIRIESNVIGESTTLRVRNSGVVYTGTFIANSENVVFVSNHGAILASLVFMQSGSNLIVDETSLVKAAFVTAGIATTIVNNGTLEANLLLSEGSVLMGNGEVTGEVIAEGLIAPGESPGRLTLGALDLRSSGKLQMEIGGTQLGTYDELAIADVAKLGGTLEIRLIDGFIPNLSDNFDLLSAMSIEGRFDFVNVFGGSFDIEYSPTGVSITHFRPLTHDLAGDIDRDGDVDRADAARFAKYYGTVEGSSWSTGDFDGDGVTSLNDLALLQANLSATSPTATPLSATVPEPSAIGLLATAALFSLGTRRHAWRLKRWLA